VLVPRLGRLLRPGPHRGRVRDATVDQVHLVVALGGDLRVVGGDHDHGAAIGLGAQLGDDEVAVGLVELARRLVRQQHVGLDREGTGDRDPLPLPAGQLGDESVGQVSDTEALEGGGGALHGLARLDVAAPQGDGEVLLGGEGRHEAVGLQHEGGARAGLPVAGADGSLVVRRRTCVWTQQAAQHTEQRGLAGAARPRHREHPSRGRRQRHVVENRTRPAQDADVDRCQLVVHVPPPHHIDASLPSGSWARNTPGVAVADS
jgi:hypothetical protein